MKLQDIFPSKTSFTQPSYLLKNCAGK